MQTFIAFYYFQNLDSIRFRNQFWSIDIAMYNVQCTNAI